MLKDLSEEMANDICQPNAILLSLQASLYLLSSSHELSHFIRFLDLKSLPFVAGDSLSSFRHARSLFLCRIARIRITFRMLMVVNGTMMSITRVTFAYLQYKHLCTISNNIEVYDDPVPRTKEITHHAVKFEAGEENRIV